MAPCPAWIATAFCARSAQSRLEQSQSVRVHGSGLHHAALDGLGARLRIALKLANTHHDRSASEGSAAGLFDAFSTFHCTLRLGRSGTRRRVWECPRRRRVLLLVHMFRRPASRLLDPFSPNGSCPSVAPALICGPRSVRLPRNCIWRPRKSRRLRDSEVCPGRLRRRPALSCKAH
jgi:hypothetical protein